jgi:hypothetical protein
MLTKTFTSGRIRRADYNPESQQLDLHWDNTSPLACKEVPHEVFRRLCSAPYPATYWEDRIAEEYPTIKGSCPHSPLYLSQENISKNTALRTGSAERMRSCIPPGKGFSVTSEPKVML